MKKKLDARGMACPLPVVNAGKLAQDMVEGDVLEIITDNEAATENLTRFAEYKGYGSKIKKLDDNEYVVTMVSGEAVIEENEASDIEDMVVVISSDKMGDGDEKLGKTLMKSFVFALTKQDVYPSRIILYNSGAFLTSESSEVLEDLTALEGEGTEILTCGTCMDYYNLGKKPMVGSVTNMYEIVAIMENAAKIIRP